MIAVFVFFHFALALFSPPLSGQSLQSVQPLQKEVLRFGYLENKAIEHLVIDRERIFEGSALYGFMNGGSELFLEYGFQQLLEQRLTFQDIPFVAEYYLMDSPQNAYGIYSIHTFRCRRADERFPIECLTHGLLQLYHGYLYINLKCLNREIDAQPLLDTLAALILHINPIATSTNPLNENANNLKENVYHFKENANHLNENVDPFKESANHLNGNIDPLDLNSYPPPYSGVLYYICGDLGLSAAYIKWAQHFAPYQNYAMWLRIDPQTQKATAHVRFASDEDAKSFYAQNSEQLSLKQIQDKVLTISAL